MARYLRPRLPGVPIFFTVALADRGSRLLLDEVSRLREAVRVTRAERPFEIAACVVLPDHLHCIWRLPKEDCDYSTRWKLRIKAHFSRCLPEQLLRPSHRARGERGASGSAGSTSTTSGTRRIWRRTLRYCWFNPVKHGLVTRPEDWPWSSFHREKAMGLL